MLICYNCCVSIILQAFSLLYILTNMLEAILNYVLIM